MRLILILLGLVGLAPAQQTFLYSAGSGDTTCKFHTNTPTPTTVDFTCTNPRGTFGGYYTPTTTNTATDVMTIGMAGGVGNTGNEVCMMAVNMTGAAVTIGSFNSVPAGSVVFQCAGGAASAAIPLVVPPTSTPLPQTKKGAVKK
jgi:hypothetical protein